MLSGSGNVTWIDLGRSSSVISFWSLIWDAWTLLEGAGDVLAASASSCFFF